MVLPTTSTKDPRTNILYRPYQPFGACLDLFYTRADEVLISGPAGTGKSRACLEKLHLCASKYPGMRGLMIRKTRESLTQSAMVTFDRFVLPPNGTVRFRTAEQEYRYVNGSVIALGGMDKASKVLSSEYDLIYIMQAEELSDEDWETLTTRNRFGVMPYNQIISDCNPASPTHWLKLRCDNGIGLMLNSTHEDNPNLYNHLTGRWTERGISYIKKLDNLTGVRKLRLRHGIWAAAEGMIYAEEWNPSVHQTYRKPIPRDWVRLWTIDFGFTHPLCWQAWAVNPENDEAVRFAEIYQTRLLVEDLCALIKVWMVQEGEPAPEVVICDHDAEGRATFERHMDMATTPADKSVLDGIEDVKSRLRPDPDTGRPKIYFMRDSVDEKDPDLVEAGLPTCTEEEFESYEWSDNKKKEQPKKEQDHGMDCTRYLSRYLVNEMSGWVRGAGR